MPSRRSFVRQFAFFAAAASVRSRTWQATVLAKVLSDAQADQGLLRLKLSDFPALQQEFGSVRIGTTPIGPDHYPVGIFYPVIITRQADGQFLALDSACSHESCTVPTYDPSVGYMECPCHGSRYRIDGSVLRGPANLSLRQFTVHFDGANSLSVELPDYSFALEIIGVEQASHRLHLQFDAFDQIDYELHFRPDPGASWSGPIPFAVTPTGPADQLSVVGQANYAELYVDRTTGAGLYAVVMRTSQV